VAPSLIVGADVGGSKASLVIAAGAVERAVTVPSGHWYRSGLAAVADGLAEQLTEDERSRLAVFVVGAHGCDTRDQCHRLENALGDVLGAAALALNDAELVLPAAGAEPGAALISGTGSIAIGYDADGSLISVGGWGGFLGDEGSATGLFRDSARAAVDAYDRGQRDDPLAVALCDLLALADLRDLPARLAADTPPTTWASMAPSLFGRALAEGSPMAEGVLHESAAALAELVVVLGQRGADISTVVAGGGVVANAAWMREALQGAFAERCPSSHLSFLKCEPVRGALSLAKQYVDLAGGRDVGAALHPRLREAMYGAKSEHEYLNEHSSHGTARRKEG
jgi:N-acetylglucosamine kinase-like BadF-type ATPase